MVVNALSACNDPFACIFVIAAVLASVVGIYYAANPTGGRNVLHSVCLSVCPVRSCNYKTECHTYNNCKL